MIYSSLVVRLFKPRLEIIQWSIIIRMTRIGILKTRLNCPEPDSQTNHKLGSTKKNSSFVIRDDQDLSRQLVWQRGTHVTNVLVPFYILIGRSDFPGTVIGLTHFSLHQIKVQEFFRHFGQLQSQ